jgi:hypothetical protein
MLPAGTEGTHPADVVTTEVAVEVLVEVTVIVSATLEKTVVVTDYVNNCSPKLVTCTYTKASESL